MQHVFETDRLRVFEFRGVTPMEQNTPRTLFVGFRRDEDRPMVTVTALVWMDAERILDMPWLDWIEVSTEYRREGFATEMLRGIERHIDRRIGMDPGTAEGEFFLQAYGEHQP